MVDMKMLANLALYHSRRTGAGVSYCLFLRTQGFIPNPVQIATWAEHGPLHAALQESPR